MAILQISRIQHRRGLIENLPQLASGELGWALDERRLFIGNGSLEEGAPTLGNTEILTEYSDILETSGSYSLKELAPGLTAYGTVERTLQSKLDDAINARDFGCVGDGETDDTEAINALFFRVYCEWLNQEVRRTVYFPAGEYLTSGETIKIPAWARVIGDGINSTTIRRTDAGRVFELADSRQQVGGNIGTTGGSRPQNIDITGITFSSYQGDVGYIAQSRGIYFSRVRFESTQTEPTSSSDDYRAIFMESTPIAPTEGITFDACEFGGIKYAVDASDDVYNIVVANSVFKNLYKGFRLGENTSGSGSSVVGPQGVRVLGSLFDQIGAEAVHVYAGRGFTSAFNTYRDVGNDYQGAGNPTTPVLRFDLDGHSSFGDHFDRDDTDDLVQPRISSDNLGVFGVVAGSYALFGNARQEPGRRTTLDNDTIVPESTGIEIDLDRHPTGAVVEYSIKRGDVIRQGLLRLAHGTGTGAQATEEYVESNGSTGVTFSYQDTGSGTAVLYTATDTGVDPVLRYQVRYLF